MQRVLTGSSEEALVRDWAEVECRHLDVVASWETLCEVYDALRFSDPMTDATRTEEFRWIIAEVNKFLTRVKKKLDSCKTLEAALTVLEESLEVTGQVSLDARKKIAYHKLRQRWVLNAAMQVRSAIDAATDKKEDPYAVWTD